MKVIVVWEVFVFVFRFFGVVGFVVFFIYIKFDDDKGKKVVFVVKVEVVGYGWYYGLIIFN